MVEVFALVTSREVALREQNGGKYKFFMTITTFDSSHLVKSASTSLKGSELLKADVNQLLGVTEHVATTLRENLNVSTIFDLATSWVFNGALNLADPQDPLSQECARHRLIPADLLADGVDSSSVENIGKLGIEQLNIPKDASADLKDALGIETIRDLALWTPFQAARGILASVFGKNGADPEAPPDPDPEAPPDLIPAIGNYPVQQTYFQELQLIDIDLDKDRNDRTQAKPAASTNRENTEITEKSLDLHEEVDTATSEGGFTKPVVGVSVTGEQRWYAEGVTLGKLLYTLPLAPGESTRIAIVDRQRDSSSRRKENVAETEDTTSETAAQQAIKEVTSEVAKETQTSSSTATNESDSSQYGSAGALASLLGSFGGGSSSSHQHGLATSLSRSSGTRSLSSRINRDLQENTHQRASMLRSQQAAVIQETTVAEGENMSTRVVTNYNHMHALSVQYYETVQVYRVETRATKYERLAFIPFKPFDFNDYRIIARYRAVLEKAALIESVKEVLHEAKEASWKDRAEKTVSIHPRQDSEVLFTVPFGEATLTKVTWSASGKLDGLHFNLTNGDKEVISGHKSRGRGSEEVKIKADRIASVYLNPHKWHTSLYSLVFSFESKSGETSEWTYSLSYSEWNSYGKNKNWYILDFKPTQKSYEATRTRKVIRHLNYNSIHYSGAIWGSMSQGEWMKALADDTDKQVWVNLDPTPRGIFGNYVAFPWGFSSPAEKLDWLLEKKLLAKDFRKWMNKKGYQQEKEVEKLYLIDEQPEWLDEATREYLREHDEIEGDQGKEETRVSWPAGGVFAEAVLGRANSAEKVDPDRFWDWKTSPIPIVPTEINPLGNQEAEQLMNYLKAQGAQLLQNIKGSIYQLIPKPEPHTDVPATKPELETGVPPVIQEK